MSRVALCLFFIAIFQNGIQISSSAPSTEESKQDKDVTTKEPTKDSQVKDTDVKDAIEVQSDGPKKGKKIAKESEEERDSSTEATESPKHRYKSNEPKKSKKIAKESSEEQDSSSEATDSNDKKSSISRVRSKMNPLSTGFEVTGTLLSPVMKARDMVGGVLAKGMDGAKDVADGTYHFFRTSIPNFFS